MYDEQLIRRIGQGDMAAAEELAADYYPQILRYCRFHVPTPSLAEDAAQETFLKAIRYLDQYEHRGHFKAFLYRIAANVCIDIGRRRSSTEDTLDEMDTIRETTSHLDAIESKVAMEQMVKTLPLSLQEIIFLRFSQDLTLKEISQVLNIPMRTAQSRLRTALRLLKQTYQRGDLL